MVINEEMISMVPTAKALKSMSPPNDTGAADLKVDGAGTYGKIASSDSKKLNTNTNVKTEGNMFIPKSEVMFGLNNSMTKQNSAVWATIDATILVNILQFVLGMVVIIATCIVFWIVFRRLTKIKRNIRPGQSKSQERDTRIRSNTEPWIYRDGMEAESVLYDVPITPKPSKSQFAMSLDAFNEKPN